MHRVQMPKNNKLTHHSRAHYKGSKRSKPKVSQLNRELRAKIERELQLVQSITADAELRKSLASPFPAQVDPLVVWHDSDQYRELTSVAAEWLPKWTGISDYLKIHIFNIACQIFGGYSFTAVVSPVTQDRWLAKGMDPSLRISKRIANEITLKHLSGHPFVYVVEGKTRSGRVSTNLHIHGILQTDNQHVATAFKVMLEKAIGPGKLSKEEAGYKPKSGDPIKLERLYDAGSAAKGTAGRWASYIAKNATRPDKRLGRKRVTMSKEARALAREFWGFMKL
jgi:hypothetical protein